MRADFARQLQLLLAHVEGDHPGRGQCAQQLHGEMPQTADADHHRRAAGQQLRQRSAERVIRGQPRVGEGCGLHRVESVQRHQVPGRVHQHILRQGTG